MSGLRRVTAEFTAAAAILALSAGLILTGAAQWTSTASASVLPISSNGSSSVFKKHTRNVRVILPSMYQPAALDIAASPITAPDVSAPLAQKGDFLGASAFSPAPADQTIAFQLAQ